MAKKKKEVSQELLNPFYQYIWQYYIDHKKIIRRKYKDLTKKILDHADPEKNSDSFLRTPQFQAFEIYVFLKEYLENPNLADLLKTWLDNSGEMKAEDTNSPVNRAGQIDMFAQYDAKIFKSQQEQLDNLRQDYINYIFSLTMGTGKTILMALCIYYEFLLADKYPHDPLYCHNALVLAPDTTVLQSLKEIQTFDKVKIFEEGYANKLETKIHYHFLEDDGVALSTQDDSDFNLIITTSQKIILKKKNKTDTAADSLFKDQWQDILANNPNADLYILEDDKELTANQRYRKLTLLPQLGIYVDEAHHAFGKALKTDMLDRSKETSLRLTIDNLAKELASSGSKVVACYNFTGTPYIDNHLMPEVVYEYGLKPAIDNMYLKKAVVKDFENVKCDEFIHDTVKDFIKIHKNENGEFNRYEGMLPKIAFFAETQEILDKELLPAVEKALQKNHISTDKILVNTQTSSNDEIKEFKKLDTHDSEKQFIILIAKGKEGWNCRSLFSVALYREPKSTIFVLQATMRCLRAITDVQQEGKIYLSAKNKQTLENELQSNFCISLEQFTGSGAEKKPRRKIYVRKTVEIKVKQEYTEYKLKEKKVGNYTLFDENFIADKYKKVTHEQSLTSLNVKTKENEITSNTSRQFTELSLVAEISMYLTEHTEKEVRFSPVQIKAILEKSSEGIEKILEKVNYNNDILYDFVIPELFKKMYEIEEEKKLKDVTLTLVNPPPEGHTDENGIPCYEISAADELYADENADNYKAYNQTSKSKKSFDVSGYGFDSTSEMNFFNQNITNNNIKYIWFTGMFTHGQSGFLIRYIDPETNALRSYFPDFLIETLDGKFFIVEIKGRNLVDQPTTKAKVAYALRMAQASQIQYVFIPDDQANQTIEEFLRNQEIMQNNYIFKMKDNVSYDRNTIHERIQMLKVASPKKSKDKKR